MLGIFRWSPLRAGRETVRGMIVRSDPVGRLSYEVSLGTGIFYSRKKKMCSAQALIPLFSPSLPPHFLGALPRKGPWYWLLSPPPRGGLPRPRGPDGAAGSDVADPALSHPTFRLPVLWVAASPGPDADGIPALWQGCVYQQASSSAYQLSLPAPCRTVPLPCNSHFVLHTPAFAQDSYLIANHFEYHDHRLIVFFYFKGRCWCVQ